MMKYPCGDKQINRPIYQISKNCLRFIFVSLHKLSQLVWIINLHGLSGNALRSGKLLFRLVSLWLRRLSNQQKTIPDVLVYTHNSHAKYLSLPPPHLVVILRSFMLYNICNIHFCYIAVIQFLSRVAFASQPQRMHPLRRQKML